MKRSSAKALAAGCLLISAPAIAAPGMSSSFAIDTVFARDIGYDFYATTTSNPMACSVNGSFRLKLDATNFASMVSTILTAFASSKKIAVWVSGCDSDGASTVTGVRIN